MATVGTWAAYQLGAFVNPATPLDYVRQAEYAAAQELWTAPPAHNVVDLTRAAIDLWPNDPSIERLRQRMAHRLAAVAAHARGTGVERAEELHRAAVELDPSPTGSVLGRETRPSSPASKTETAADTGEDQQGARD